MDALLIFTLGLLYRIGIDLREKFIINKLKKLPKPESKGIINYTSIINSLKNILPPDCCINISINRDTLYSHGDFVRAIKIDQTQALDIKSNYPCQVSTEQLLKFLYEYLPGCVAGSCNADITNGKHRFVTYFADNKWFFVDTFTDREFVPPPEWNIYRVVIDDEPEKSRPD